MLGLSVMLTLGTSARNAQAQPTSTVLLPTLLAYAGGHAIRDITLSPASPAVLLNMQPVTATFRYHTTEAAGIRIWALPYRQGAVAPGYMYQGSDIEPPAYGRQISRWASIITGSTTVDAIHLVMRTADATLVLFETDVAVSFSFGP